MGEWVTIKVMEKEAIQVRNTGLLRLQTEIFALRTLKHPNIVQLYEVISDENIIYIVMEYVKGGDLVMKITEEETKLDEDTKR